MKATYIKTTDFTIEDVEIINVLDNEQLMEKIKENEVIKIKNGNQIEYINSAYIMFYELEE